MSLHISANALILHLTPYAMRTLLAVTGVVLQYYQVSKPHLPDFVELINASWPCVTG